MTNDFIKRDLKCVAPERLNRFIIQNPRQASDLHKNPAGAEDSAKLS
jgi:hypothetical protein